MFVQGFKEIDIESKIVDVSDIFPLTLSTFYSKTVRLPNTIKQFWEPSYFKLINQHYKEIFDSFKPGIILIYNNQYILPDTLKYFKSKCLITFYLGDNPLYSHTFDYNLSNLFSSNYTICNDSYWKFQLEQIGIPNVACDYIGFPQNIFFKTYDIPQILFKKYECDLLFIGNTYRNSAGFKRTLFLNSFKDFNLKIFGRDEWYRWLKEFPELKTKFFPIIKHISNKELNIALNCAKIYPIDQNPGIINGIHSRVFEAIGAEILPIVEWRADIDPVFENMLPVIKCYRDSADIINYWLSNENKRTERISELKFHLFTKYSPKLLITRMLNHIF